MLIRRRRKEKKKRKKPRKQYKHDQFSLEGGVCITDLLLCKRAQSCVMSTPVLKMGVCLPRQLCYDAVGGEGTVENSQTGCLRSGLGAEPGT